MGRTENDSWEITESVGVTGYDRRPPGDIEGATPQTLFVAAERIGGN